jgi:hypothetical protein
MASTNASFGNEEFPEILKGHCHEMKWRATDLVTKQKARVKRASDSS